MPTWTWPYLMNAPSIFYADSLAPTRALWSAWRVPGAVGSGRPAGPRNWQWSATTVLAIASLEAGLEELLLAAHARRISVEGQTILRKERGYLVESALQAPNAGKIERAVFTAFGTRMNSLSPLPPEAHFTARRKDLAHAGSGRGAATPSPTTWLELAKWLDAVVFIRHAIAHGDVARHTSFPSAGEGMLWVKMQNGRWSVQQPHALTSLRVVVAVYNAVASVLASALGAPGTLPLTLPDDVFDYGS